MDKHRVTPFRGTELFVDLAALNKNFLWLKSLSPDFLCPMIKANAYGHGDIQIAKSLESWGCQVFGVGLVEEGLGLRAAGVQVPILVFGFSGDDAVKTMLAHNLTPVISDGLQLESFARLAKAPISVHIKLNTGMNRRGFRKEEWGAAMEALEKNSQLEVKGLGTHLLEGEDLLIPSEGKCHSLEQIQCFQKMVANFPHKKPVLHVYNSAGMASILLNQQKMEFGSRPGLLTYGVSPMNDQRLTPLISPVMAFHSNIVSTQHVKSGEVVSYGGIWRAERDALIGIVPAGYADGVCRSLSNRGNFLVRGRRVPIVGRVCMDYTMVDLTDFQLPKEQLVGEPAVLFGQQQGESIDVFQVAEAADRTTYEILTGVSERVPRHYIEM